MQLGHRLSVDIDLFTDAEYGSLDFDATDTYLRNQFKYVDTMDFKAMAFGKSYYIGNSSSSCVKLDLFYTDNYIEPYIECDSIRLATVAEIAAMKLEVIRTGGRKKDFWDLHKILESYDISELLKLHKKRYPYTHYKEEIIEKLGDFSIADDNFDPICLENKYWELIKLDILQIQKKYYNPTRL